MVQANYHPYFQCKKLSLNFYLTETDFNSKVLSNPSICHNAFAAIFHLLRQKIEMTSNPFESTGTHMSQLGGIQVICPILFRNLVYLQFLLPWSHQPVTTRVATRIRPALAFACEVVQLLLQVF